MKYILVMQVNISQKVVMWLDSQIFEDVTTIFSIRNALSMYARSCLCLKSSDFARNRICVVGLK